MKLGYLKKALTRFPSDMDDSEVLIMFHNGEKIDYDCLTFVSYAPMDSLCSVVLGTLEAGREQSKLGKLHFPNGSDVNPETFDIKPDEEDDNS